MRMHSRLVFDTWSDSFDQAVGCFWESFGFTADDENA